MNDISPAERGVGMVFQSYALYPHLSEQKHVIWPETGWGEKGD